MKIHLSLGYAALLAVCAFSVQGSRAFAQIAARNLNAQELALLKFAPQRGVQYPVGAGPTALCFDGAAIWVTNYDGNTITRLDARTGALIGTHVAGNGPYGICFDGVNIWVANDRGHTVTKLSGTTGATLATINAGNSSFGICSDGANIWAVCRDTNSVAKIDRQTNAVLGTFPVGRSPRGICFDGVSLWVSNAEGPSVTELNPTTGATRRTYPITSGGTPNGICYVPVGPVGYQPGIFCALTTGDKIVEIRDASSAFPVGSSPWAMSFNGAHLAVTNYGSDSVSGLSYDATQVPVGKKPMGICYDGAYFWVANYGSNTVSKL